MTNKNKDKSKFPKSKVVSKRRLRISLVWIIPIIAAVAGVWIAITDILEKGPEITIIFQSADGLEAQKTKINYNGLDVGIITDIKLGDDHKTIISTAQMDPDASELMVEDTRFWVVRPRINGMSITGLSTIISGDYIGMQAGKSKVNAKRFVALDTPPIIGNTSGRVFTLKMDNLGSIGIGTSVFFRKLEVGKIVSYKLDKSGKFLHAKVFIKDPYDKFVNADTRFWQASGVDLSMSANGIKIKTESLMAILEGGIAFETPDSAKGLKPVKEGAVFKLFSTRAEAFMPPPYNPHSYLLVFKQSIRGLSVGAPVLFYGITIGEVTEIKPLMDMKKMEVCVHVIISIDPRRYGVTFINSPDAANKEEANRKMISSLNSRGFRAQLETGNLLTGSLLISFTFIPDTPKVALDWSLRPTQLPTVSNTFTSIENNAAALVKNLNKISIDALSTISDINKLIRIADQLVNNANQLIEPSSLMNSELNKLLRQSNGAVRAFGILADYLERHPESLIYGKQGEPK